MFTFAFSFAARLFFADCRGSQQLFGMKARRLAGAAASAAGRTHRFSIAPAFRIFAPCAVLLLCLRPLAFSQVCTGLCLEQVTCPGNATTSLSGYVYDPANHLPVPDAIVYVPNGPVQPFVDGPAGRQQISGSPLLIATTNISGAFTLDNMPVGRNIPLVVQAGLWRRQFAIPTIASCRANTVSNGTYGSHLTLPASHFEGDIPKTAVVTGSDSSVECVALAAGVSPSEFTDPGGGGRINLYEGDGLGGAVMSSSSPAESTLFSSQANLNAYGVVMFGSQGQADPDATTQNQLELANFANAGGRVFVETPDNGWLDGNSSFPGTVNWTPGQGAWGNYLGDSTYNADIDQTFSRGVGLAAWLNQATVYGGTLNQIPVGVIRNDFTSVNPGVEQWLYTANGNQDVGGQGEGPGPNIPLQFTFNTPVGSSSQPGRVWFNDYLVEAAVDSAGYHGLAFPAECPTGGMTPQQMLFEYGLFDLTASLGPPTATVAVTHSLSTFTQGDAADTLTITVSDTSATAMDTSLTLTAVLPAGLTAVSMAGQNAGTAWACNSSTLVCTRNAPLSVTASDPITLTVAVAANAPAGTGALTVSATAAGGGLVSGVNSSDAVTIAISSDTVGANVFGNGGFETGAPGAAPPAPWTVNTYLNNGFTPQTPQTFAGLNLASGGRALTVIEASGTGPLQQPDPDLGTAASLRWPRYGSQAVSVNQQSTSTIVSQNVNSLSQTITVGMGDIDPNDNKPHFRFTFAPVFLHDVVPVDEEPYYFIQVTNITQNTVLYEDFVTDTQSGIPWQSVNTGQSTQIDYTDWQLVDATAGAPAVNIGDSIKLLILAANNQPGLHFGRVWVDGVGNAISGITVEGSAPASVNPGANLTYTLAYRNGSFSAEDNAVVNFVTPANTTFQAVSSSASCTTPAAGSSGTVSCNLGTLSAGASGSLTVTVNISNGAPIGTLVMRNYGISSTQETTLLGPPISTAVGCTTDSACSAGNWCNESLGACTSTLANSVLIPIDPSHTFPRLNGTCTSAAATLVCTSGVCDSNNNKCGYNNGDGTCSNSNAAVVCDSGACSVSGVCKPAGGCVVNADCSSGMQCSASMACIPGLTVTAWPTASPINPGQTLAASTLTGGAASASGTFSWTNPATVPPAGTSSQSVTFIPTDTTDYAPLAGSVLIQVNGPATNLVVTTPADDTGNVTNCTLQASAGTGSDPSCSLRDALLFAGNAGSGRISFDGTVFSASNSAAMNTITLNNGTLNIPANTTITFGPGTITVATTAGVGSPFGFIDKAVDSVTGSTTVGPGDSLKVQGWVADPQDGAPLSNVAVYIDGASIGAPTLGIARPDVAAARNNSDYLYSGYQLLYPNPASSLSLGAHQLTVVAIDSGGRSTTFGPSSFTVATTSGAGSPFGFIDKAVDNVTGSTTVSQADSLKVLGWVADPQDGAPLSNVSVYVDGTLAGTPTLGIARPDVAAARNNSAYLNSGYRLLYSASSLSLGKHQLTVVAIDSGGRSTTFGPRVFTVQ